MKRDAYKFLAGPAAGLAYAHVGYAVATSKGIITEPIFFGRKWGVGFMTSRVRAAAGTKQDKSAPKFSDLLRLLLPDPRLARDAVLCGEHRGENEADDWLLPREMIPPIKQAFDMIDDLMHKEFPEMFKYKK